MTPPLRNILVSNSFPDDFFELDAALIKFPESKTFVFDQHLFVNSICLPNKFDNIDESWDGEIFTITGFGEINSNKDKPRKLQLAEESMKIQF